jgi:hypothetical protein
VSTKIKTAARDVRDAEASVAAAEDALVRARERLDAELAAAGWQRLRGAFSPGARALYTNPAHAGATLDAEAVIRAIDARRAAA